MFKHSYVSQHAGLASIEAIRQRDLEDDLKFHAQLVASGSHLSNVENDKLQAFMKLLAKAISVDLSNGQHMTNWHAGIPTGVSDYPIVIFEWGNLADELASDVALTQKAIADGVWDGDRFICKDLEGNEVQLKLNQREPDAEMNLLALIATGRSGAVADVDKFIGQKYLRLAADGWLSLTPAGESALKAHGFEYDAKQGWVKVPKP